jgi:hypothetical protein
MQLLHRKIRVVTIIRDRDDNVKGEEAEEAAMAEPILDQTIDKLRRTN